MSIKRAAEHELVMAAIGKPKSAPKPKKANNPPIDKADILTRRGYYCDCDCGQRGHDLHHAFIGRKKGYPILDDERNLVLVNHNEHIARLFDNVTNRRWFWKVQVRRYGKKAMMEWIDAVLAAGLDKSRLDFLR